MRCRIALIATLIGVALIASVFACAEQAAEQNRKAPAKNAPQKDGGKTERDPIFTGPPLTLTGVIEVLLAQLRAGASEKRVNQIVADRHVAFPRTEENMNTLRIAGVPDWLLETIRRAEGPPLPVAPKPKIEPKGTLEVSCQPKECDVRLEGLDPASTSDGTHVFPDLKPRKYVLEVGKPGYTNQQHEIDIHEGSNPRGFTLMPNNDTLAKFGADLRNAMLTALGSDSGRKDIRQFSGKGKLTSWDRDGGETVWDLTAVFRADGATLDVKGAPADWIFILDCKGDACTPRPVKKSKIPPDQAQNLRVSLENLNEYRFVRLLDLITAAGTSVSAMSAQLPPKGDQPFQVRSADGASYDVVLDWQARPVSITLGSRSGLGGLHLSFDKYAPVKTGQLPQNIEVKLPNGKQGVRVQFTELKPVP